MIRGKSYVAPILGIAVTLLLPMAFILSGCVVSDTITERIYDDNDDSEVDANIAPILINSVTATETNDELPKLDNDPHSESANETQQALPVYTANPEKANTSLEAKRTKFVKGAADNGEASLRSSARSKSETEQGSKNETNRASDDGATKQNGENGAPDDEETGSKTKGKGGGSASSGKRSSGGTGSFYSLDADTEPVIPDNIDEVAAVGNNAVIVSLVAGKAKGSALLACDADTKSKAAKVLKARGIGNAASIWKNDGDASGDLTSANLDKLINKVVPDLVFVTEGSDTVSKAQRKKLAGKDIDVYELPELTSATRIKFAVELVGRILDKGGVSGAKANYKKYLEFHDEITAKYSEKCGGITGGYDFDQNANAEHSADDTIATLYIDKWEKNARYSDSDNNISTPEGIGLATLGYDSAPISYYLSVGGVLNNAVSSTFRGKKIKGTGVVWQFARNQLSYAFSKWKNLDASYDLSTIDLGGIAFRSNLLWYTGSGISGFGFATDKFPAVVVKSESIGTSFKSSSTSSGDPYYHYPTITTSSGQTVGYKVGSRQVEACIGNDGTGASRWAGQMKDKIYTNPKGLCQKDSKDPLCSWADGSVESVLEASWAYYRFRGGDQKDFRADVKKFYSTFYGYDTLSTSELAAIEAGPAK